MRDKQREETRRRLYTAALDVFRTDGFLHCRIDEIAARADVSRATFYFHFPTKEGVLLDFLQYSEDQIVGRLETAPPDLELPMYLSAVAQAMAEFWQNEPRLLPDVAAVWLRGSATPGEKRTSRIRTTLSARFARETALNATRMPAEVLADIFVVNCLAAMMSWASAPETRNLNEVLQGVTRMFLNGVSGGGVTGDEERLANGHGHVAMERNGAVEQHAH